MFGINFTPVKEAAPSQNRSCAVEPTFGKDHLYARRVRGLKGSATRDLMSALSDPGLISLAGGFPDTTLFGDENFRKLADEVSRESATALQYGPTGGSDGIKGVIVQVMDAEGTRAQPENLFVTTGAQQGLDLVAKVFLDEGDAVLCEAPTYAGALNAFAAYRPRILHVPTDGDGMVVSEARKVLRKARRDGMTVKFVYTVPTFHNPAGTTMPEERRRELLELAREFDLMILEDNPYGMLRFEGEAPPTISSIEREETQGPDRVVYLGTFSKVFAPGVRLGWVHASEDILERINLVKQGADLCSSNLSQMLVVAYFEGEDWGERLERLTSVYRERRDAMLDALTEFMPEGVSWTKPEGGLFVWVTLPEGVDAATLLDEALERGVAYVPGAGFYADGGGEGCMRLNFSFVDSGRIRRAVKLLAGVVRDEMERQGLGTGPAFRVPDHPPQDWDDPVLRRRTGERRTRLLLGIRRGVERPFAKASRGARR